MSILAPEEGRGERSDEGPWRCIQPDSILEE